MVKRRSSEVLPMRQFGESVDKSPRRSLQGGTAFPTAEQSIYNIIYIYNIYSYTYTWNFLGPPMAWALGGRSGRLGSEPGLEPRNHSSWSRLYKLVNHSGWESRKSFLDNRTRPKAFLEKLYILACHGKLACVSGDNGIWKAKESR